jgi:hypothetical protein
MPHYLSRVFVTLTVIALGVGSLRSHAAEFPERLVNLSSRAQAGEGDAALIAGFAVAEGPDKLVLVRAIGPAGNRSRPMKTGRRLMRMYSQRWARLDCPPAVLMRRWWSP